MRLLAGDSDRGKRLDLFLHERLAGYSRSRLQSWIKQGRVQVDGADSKASSLLRGGETVDIEPGELPALRAEPEDLPVEILYADQDVLAVNKPAGLVVHAGAGHASGTLTNRLVHHFGTLSSVGGGLRPGIVHRLDRDTSGVLLVARNDAAHRRLAAQFAARTVEKIYIALVHGVVRQDRGRISDRIARDPVRRTRMTVRTGSGRTAITEYKVLRRFAKFTLLEVRIGTGRTHQIRVHLASRRHAIVGDRLYGAPARVEGMPPLARFFLHARGIAFDQPSTGERIVVESPIPEELARWLEALD
jgi:23S rRNA pseudouridine1911/1915/1917 synthase